MAASGKEDVGAMTNVLEKISLDDLKSQHRREKKEMQAKIQALKKNAPKNDKKKRKEAMEEVARMESELEQRHAKELKEHNSMLEEENLASEPTTSTTDSGDSPAVASAEEKENVQATQRISKAQKRRDKKAREARDREEEIRLATEDLQDTPKTIEAKKIEEKLKLRDLSAYQVPSDGDCLYNAIRHQLQQHGLVVPNVQELRNETANYIVANKDALIFYMTNQQTGDLLTADEFEKYCDSVRNTPAWGGQIELKALSSILKVPIEVLQADGPPTLQGVDEFSPPNLIITYHRHLYRLGEHYNSTVPLDKSKSDDFTE